MNSKAINLIKNFSYTLTSNLISLLISILVVLIVPKIIGVEEYGYWQLYLFYSSYVGFMHFGWNDGIYLRYGGMEYKELDKGLFGSQFYMLAISQIIIGILISIIAILFLNDGNRIFIVQMVAINMIIMNICGLLQYILQASNRIREYSQIVTISRILYFCFLITFILIGVREYKLLIGADLTGKLISLVYAMYCCRDIVFRRIFTLYFGFKEAIENVSVGIKLMFSNIVSTLIIGVVRFGIERSWDVATFGKVSLTLSVSNLMMLFINAIGIIMFPILRRTDEKKLPSIYVTMRDFLMVLMLGLLIIYYPLKIILSAWLPKYAESLMYMALVFPMCVYEGKMSLLINTYLKTLRKEKLMLRINLNALSLSLVIAFLTTQIMRNLDLAIVSIVILLAFRSVLAELYLSRMLGISVYKDIVLEVTMTLIFILTGWFINSWLTVLLYGLSYIIYLVIKRKDIVNTVRNIKLLVKP